MEKRTWLAVVLSCLVYYGYMRFFAPPVEVPPVGTAAPATAGSSPTAPAPGKDKPAALTQGSGIPVPGSVPGSPFASRPGAGVETERLTNAAREIVLSDVGGKPVTVGVLGFNQTMKADSPKIQSLDAGTMPHAMGTLFTDPVLSSLGTARYAKKSADGKTTFQKTEAGVQVTKTFTEGSGEFFLDEEIRIVFPSTEKKDWGYLLIPLGGVGLTQNLEDPLQSWEAVSYQNESLTRKHIDDIESGSAVSQGTTQWIAFGNRYFSNAVVNESAINPDVVFEKGGDFAGVFMRFPLVTKSDSREMVLKLKLFSGPKEYSELAKVPGLRRLIDYGMFSFLAYPMLEILRFFYKFVHNYGLAIILLTLLVRLLFYPLSLKSYRSMKGMQKLQPQINALKEKYKDDMQKFGQEQMALFRAHKVNPAGGCLPILVQLPVFIALYALLQNSIELFHAPFFGWVQDLSSKDPYYIFPVLMGISMFVQQKMTPAAGMDPMQQKILLLMPVIFSVVMFNLPAGLTMYIFVSTLLGILQQVLMNREQKTGKLVTAPPPV